MSKRKRDSKAVAGCARLDMLFDPGSFTEIGIHATYAAIAPDLEDLYDVINEGYGKVSILLTSNRDRAEWPDLFGEALLASAALDRLTHGAHFLEISGASFRAEHTKKQATARRARPAS